ncbi:MAG: YitT family protein [Lachnospiraceae bacterium]
MEEKKQKITWRRFVFMIIGVMLIGFSVSFNRIACFGTDPFSCMNIGVSSHLPISYGTYQVILNIILFIPVIILCPRSFGIGALFNMFFVGYSAELGMFLFSLFGVNESTFIHIFSIRFLIFLVGVLLLCFGVALYMECDLGAAPYDMIGQIVDERTHGKIKFKWVRIFTDCLCMTIGYISGGTVGLATILISLFTGPVVSFFREHGVKKIVGNEKKAVL